MKKQKQSTQKSTTGVLAALILFSVCLSAAKCSSGAPDSEEAAADEFQAPPFSKEAADALFYEKLPRSRGKDLKGRVNDYLKVQFKSPMPWDFFQSMGKDSVPIFIAVIKDPNRSGEWRNAVGALGKLQDARATRPLIELLENTEGPLPSNVSDALFDVPDRLGFIAAAGDKEALDYLISHLPVDSWGRLKWQEEKVAPGVDAFHHMSSILEASVIGGLGVSGLPKAKTVLINEIEKIEHLKESDVSARGRLMSLQGALELNDEIQRMGLRNYYSLRKKGK